MGSNPFLGDDDKGSSQKTNPFVGGSSGAPKKVKPRNPNKELVRGLARYIEAQTAQGVKYPQIDGTVASYLRGMTPREVRRASEKAELPAEFTEKLVGTTRDFRRREDEGGGLLGIGPVGLGASAFGWTLRQASRPSQAVLAALGEQSRQGENNPVQIGPVSVRLIPTDPGKVLEAAGEGFMHKRHDSPVSIAMEAGKIREKQGVGTESFGFVPGTDLRTGQALPGGVVGKMTYDVGGAAATDPLTYLTFGVGAVAKTGLVQARRVLGAERAAEILRAGPGILTAEEKARLGVDVVNRLKGVQGGLGVRVPQPGRALRGGRLLSDPKTVIPGRYLGADVLKAGTRRLGATKAGAVINGMFVPRSRVLQLEREGRLPVGTADEMADLAATARGTAASRHQANVALLRRIAKDVRLDADEALEVSKALDTGDLSRLTENGRIAYGRLDEYRRAMSARLREAGLLPAETVDGPVGIAGSRGVTHSVRSADATNPYGAIPEGHVRIFRGETLGGKMMRDIGYDTPFGRMRDTPAPGSSWSLSHAAAAKYGDRVYAVDIPYRDLPLNDPDIVRAMQLNGDDAALASRFPVEKESIRGPIGPTGRAGSERARALAERARQQAAEHEARIAGLRDEAEFLDVPSTRNPASGEFGPSVNPASDVTLAKRLTRALERQKVLDRRAAVLDRAAAKMEAVTRGIADDVHFPHVPRISGSKPGPGVAANQADAATDVKGIVFGRADAPSVQEGYATPGFAKRRTGGPLEEELAAGRDLETNPFAAYATRSVEQERALAAREYTDGMLRITDADGNGLLSTMDDAAARLNMDVADLTPEYLKSNGMEKVEIKGLGDYVVDEAIAPEFKKMARLVASEDETKKVLKFLDQWMTLWKGYATVPLPFGVGFHVRNATGNVMLNWLAGGVGPSDYTQAYTLQRRISKGMREGDPLKYLSGETRLIAQEALRRDIVGGGGFFLEDIPLDTLRGFRSRGKRAMEATNPLDPNNLLIRGGRAVGKGIEENARLAHFIAKYRQFGSFEDAALSTRRYLFDYGDLTRFEQEGMKRIMPFYTFTRKNTPLWVAAAFKTPGKYSRIQQWRTAFFDAAGRPNSEVTPEYVEEAGGVPLPFKINGETVMFSPDLPPIAASETIDRPFQAIRNKDPMALLRSPVEMMVDQTGGGAPGLVKAIIEAYAADKNFFSGRPFYPGEREALPSYLQGTPYALLAEDRVVDGKKQPSIDARQKYVLEQLLPLLPKIESSGLLYNLPGVKRGSTVDRDRELRRQVSMFSGLQIYPLGESTQRSEKFRRAQQLAELLQLLRSRGVPVPANPGEFSGESTGSSNPFLP